MNEDKKKKLELATTAGEAVDTAQSIVTLFGNSYIGSSWDDFNQVGVAFITDEGKPVEKFVYYHRLECVAIKNVFVECKLSGRFILRCDAIEIKTKDEAVSIFAGYKDKYEICQYSGNPALTQDMVDAIYPDGGTVKSIKIRRHEVDNGNFFICDYSKAIVHRSCRMSVHGCDAIKVLWTENPMTVKFVYNKYKPLFQECQNCGQRTLKDLLVPEPLLNNKPSCKPCREKAIKMNLIYPHNHSMYPRPIYTEMTRLGCTTEPDGTVKATNRPQKEQPKRLFGFEIETEFNMAGMIKAGIFRTNIAEDIYKVLGRNYVVIKEDGTLTMNGKYSNAPEFDPEGLGKGPKYAGFEIVTAPADLAFHRKQIPLIESSKYYNLFRAWDTDTCGFHVHVSRDSLTSLQIGRILVFINHKRNTLFVQKVAGRGNQKFTKYIEKEPGDALVRNERTDENRRQAVNLCNKATIEFRIFRGTINPKHIIRNLEFCDSVCEFAAPASRSMSEYCDYRNYVMFVDQNRKRWPLLASWCAVNDFINQPLVPKSKKADLSKMTLRQDLVAEGEILVK